MSDLHHFTKWVYLSVAAVLVLMAAVIFLIASCIPPTALSAVFQ
jgi:hypothetical protein